MRPPPKAVPRPRRSSATSTQNQNQKHQKAPRQSKKVLLPNILLQNAQHQPVKPSGATEEKENNVPPPKFKREEMTLSSDIYDIVPDTKLYRDMVEAEQRLDHAIMNHRIRNQSRSKPPLIISKRIRIFISHVYHRLDSGTQIPKWELRIEGRLVDDCSTSTPIIPPSHQSALEKQLSNKTNKRFSDFFSLVTVELDPRLYGTTQNIIQWKRDPASPTDGCVITRNGDSDVTVKIRFWRYSNPQKFQIQPYLAKLLGIASGTKNNILEALFLYIRTHKLQDSKEHDWINCDSHLQLVFGVPKLRMNEIQFRLQPFLFLPDPIMIEHTIRVMDKIKPLIACYEMDIEINESFQTFNTPLYESVKQVAKECDHVIGEGISNIKTCRDLFYEANRFANDPLNGLKDVIKGQSHDLQTMTESFIGTEPSSRFESYLQPNMKEAVDRYLYQKIAHKRAELETNLSSFKR